MLVAHLAGRPIALKGAPAGARTAWLVAMAKPADLDGDGRIGGAAEVRRLYSQLRAVVEPAADDKRPRGSIAPLVEALENLPTRQPQKRTDPFAPETILPAGRFSGECADVTQDRSVRLLTGAEAKAYGGRANELVVANFWHDQRFWVARIPRDAVERVAIEQMSIGLHGQTRFTVSAKTPVVLVPQTRGDTTPPVRITDFTFSAEATTVPRVAFDPVHGMLGDFVLSYRMMSLSESYRENVVGESWSVKQYPVNVTKQTANAILASALRKATAEGQHHVYNFLTDNCTIEMFAYIDPVIGYDPTGFNTRGVYPGWIPTYMKQRGIADPHHVLPNLEREFPTIESARSATTVTTRR